MLRPGSASAFSVAGAFCVARPVIARNRDCRNVAAVLSELPATVKISGRATRPPTFPAPILQGHL